MFFLLNDSYLKQIRINLIFKKKYNEEIRNYLFRYRRTKCRRWN